MRRKVSQDIGKMWLQVKCKVEEKTCTATIITTDIDFTTTTTTLHAHNMYHASILRT